MNTISEEINQQRRSFLGNAAMIIAAIQLGIFGFAGGQLRMAKPPRRV